MRLGAYNKSSAVAEQGDRLATIDIMPKSGGAAMLLSVERGTGFLSNTMSPGSRPTSVPTVPSGILIHPIFWPQYINVTDRQDIGPVAYGEQGTEPFRSRANSLRGANWPGSEKAVNREQLLVTVAQKLQVSAVADETTRRAASQQIKRAANKGGRSV